MDRSAAAESVVAGRVVGERPHQARLDQLPSWPAASRDVKNAVKQVKCLARVTFGDQQPGEREQVVLGQIGRRIGRRDLALARPRPRVIEAALRIRTRARVAAIGRTSGK